MYEFDADTQIRQRAPGIFAAELTDRWNIESVPNGGYLMAIALDALSRGMPVPDPVSATAHFVRPARPGPCVVETEVIKLGSTHATGSARMLQGDAELMRVLATFGDLGRASGPERVVARPPSLPARDDCLRRHQAGPMPEISRRFDQRFDPATMRWVRGERTGEMTTAAWQRFADGREPDVRSLPVFADALPPPIFNAVTPGWAPTIELTIHFRARPQPGWLRSRFASRFLFGGYFDEDGEIWDESGTLVVLSRQLAAAPRYGLRK